MDFSIFFYLNALGGNTERGNLEYGYVPGPEGRKQLVCVFGLSLYGMYN